MGYVLTFVVILAILILFHELGHFWAAKLFKMRVEEFALGFGKRLLRVGLDGQTAYNIRARPLGGFVRIAGMEIEDAAERRLTGAGENRAGSDMQTTNVALMEQEAAEVDGADPDGFNSRPLYQRFLVILAGPVFSIVLAWLAFCLIGVVYGLPYPGGKPTTRIASVEAGSAAARAGLTVGDTIVAVDGRPVTEWDAIVATIRTSAGKPLRLTVRGQGEATRELTVTPRARQVEGKTIGQIGVAPDFPTRRVSLGESFVTGTQLMGSYLKALGGIFASGQVRENVGGPIAIFQGTRQAVDAGGSSPLQLLAMLSLSIGIFNLLPIPVLDGGHMLVLTVEVLRRRRLEPDTQRAVAMVGLAVIGVIFVLIVSKDIMKYF